MMSELGLWSPTSHTRPSAPELACELPHTLYREDDNGDCFRIARYATQAEAKAAELARGGHKQGYFVEFSKE